ncbi:MAG: MarR family winged helix-turn-helix transcriptional regulator [Dermatophilus congolensis]|nr:MarR family winged helix-turn-helix transcriptional regulator [Dermatophilus congolensis]
MGEGQEGGREAARPTDARLALERDLAEEFAALSTASRHIEHRFSEREKLHPTDFRALGAIYVAENEGRPITAGALAAEIDLSTGATTHVVERLAASGHVYRDVDPRDRRKVVLRYADHGRAVALGFFLPLAGHTHASLAAHSDDDIRTAIRVISAAVAAMRVYDDELSAPSPG